SNVALAAIERAASGTDLRDRELGVFALVVLGKRTLEDALDEHDPKVRRAAAMASLVDDHSKRGPLLLSRIPKEPDAVTRQVLGIGLLEGDPQGELTTLMLVDRSEAGEADGPLAAMALAARTGTAQDPKVNALLASRDLVVHAHAARGLGKSSAPDAVGRLAAAYAYEFEPSVRRAILQALAEHTGADAMSPARQGTLRLAARLDPDRMVRWLATRALVGAAAPTVTEPRELSWIRITPPEGGALPANVVGTLVRSDGMAVPISFDDDGYALVPGVPPGEARLYLAPRMTAYEAGKR
ncbi:MAG: HEAT repeat domain-containing protein, partial [Polyangiaceae bacterium]